MLLYIAIIYLLAGACIETIVHDSNIKQVMFKMHPSTKVLYYVVIYVGWLPILIFGVIEVLWGGNERTRKKDS